MSQTDSQVRIGELQKRLAELADNMQDLVGRVLTNGGEPNYASEKMGRAVRAGIAALAVIDELFLERFVGADAEMREQFTVRARLEEVSGDAARVYGRERGYWE